MAYILRDQTHGRVSIPQKWRALVGNPTTYLIFEGGGALIITPETDDAEAVDRAADDAVALIHEMRAYAGTLRRDSEEAFPP